MLSSSDKKRKLILKRARFERATSKLATYRAYPKQKEFHSAGLSFRERLLRAGNQQGKSHAGGAELAFHLTGQYPAWWEGRRFDRPILGWAGGVSGEACRDNPQRILCGPISKLGSGFIPRHLIRAPRPAMGVAGLLDYVPVRHVSGENSILRLKNYGQGREKWQGPSVDAIWLDEEPPEQIYDEALARTIATGGMMYLTFTPLMGMSEVVRRFLVSNDADTRHDTNMTIEDAEHIPAEQRAAIIASFPEHEREARAKGIPTLGSGRVFPVKESDISFSAFDYPEIWPRLGGLDFGWDHPTAAVEIRHDRDADIVYVTNAYRRSKETPLIHAAAIKPWGAIPWAWPHDGLQHDKGSGQKLKDLYASEGLDLLTEKATFEDGSNGVEAGVMDMLQRMQTGRLKVASHLQDWFEEFRLYHRKDGIIVKLNDDLLSATRYALMMIRYAKMMGYRRPQQASRMGNGRGWMGA